LNHLEPSLSSSPSQVSGPNLRPPDLSFNIIFPGVGLPLQRRHPLPGILDLGQPGIGVLPEVEEALVLLNRLRLQAILLIQLGKAVMILGMDKEARWVFRIKGD
jgi:hypothetical protein